MLILGLFTVSHVSHAQSKKALEKERKEILKRIRKTNEILKKTQSDKTKILTTISTANQRINQNEKLLTVVSKEIKLLDEDIAETNHVITALQADLTEIKMDYAQKIYATYKLNNAYTKPALIFASKSVNQLLARLFFFKKFNAARREQIERILSVQKILEKRKNDNAKRKAEKQDLSKTKIVQSEQLKSLQDEQEILMKTVKKKESEIIAELKAEKNSLQDLDNLIGEHINSSAFFETLSEADKNNAGSFKKNRGKMPWPVRDGFISSKFGLQPFLKNDEATKDIKIMKLGIDIRTEPDENVRSIFEGNVVDVSYVAGRGGLIIIQHGDYFSVYSKIKDAVVKPGDKVKAKQKIASVLTQDDKISELEFQIWKNQEKLDPELWLSK